MKKNPAKKKEIDILNERLQLLLKRRLQAYSAGSSSAILTQLENMIHQTQLDLEYQKELEYHRNKKDNDDGEQWIV